jgi:hypothetical protein
MPKSVEVTIDRDVFEVMFDGDGNVVRVARVLRYTNFAVALVRERVVEAARAILVAGGER